MFSEIKPRRLSFLALHFFYSKTHGHPSLLPIYSTFQRLSTYICCHFLGTPELQETLDGRSLVPYQCAVSRDAWNERLDRKFRRLHRVRVQLPHGIHHGLHWIWKKFWISGMIWSFWHIGMFNRQQLLTRFRSPKKRPGAPLEPTQLWEAPHSTSGLDPQVDTILEMALSEKF